MQANGNSPKVSVCVITYNQEKYLHRCLQSIVDQETDFEFEVIVGDDCSTDGTPMILREFAARYPELIKPIYNENNLGYYKNYALVHAEAQAAYVAHCDGDDFWYPGKLKDQVDFLDQNPDVAAVFSNADSGGRLKYDPAKCGIHRYETLLANVFSEFLCVHSSILERRVSANPFYLEEAKQFGSELNDFEWYWLKHRNSLVYVDPVARLQYEQSPSGLSRQKKFIDSLRPSLTRLKELGLNPEALEKMHFDYRMLNYFSDPINHERPSIRTALRFKYPYGLIARLVVPTGIYYSIKLLRHPELKPSLS